LPETHPLPMEHLDFVERFAAPQLGIDKLNSSVYGLAEKFSEKVEKQNPIILSELGWANLEQTGFSDDGWRP